MKCEVLRPDTMNLCQEEAKYMIRHNTKNAVGCLVCKHCLKYYSSKEFLFAKLEKENTEVKK